MTTIFKSNILCFGFKLGFLVFLLVGVWHGLTGNYILWGLYNGLIEGKTENTIGGPTVADRATLATTLVKYTDRFGDRGREAER